MPALQIPRIVIPADETQLPTLVSVVGGAPVSAITAPSFAVVEVGDRLPWAPAQRPTPGQHLKESLTIHWLGVNPPRGMSDAESVEYLKGVARFHIDKDWGDGARLDGIAYHEAISASGTSLILRDYTDVVYHAGHYQANLASRAIVVLCGPQVPATDAQLAMLRRRYADFAVPLFAHSDWSATECPGDQIRGVITELVGLRPTA